MTVISGPMGEGPEGGGWATSSMGAGGNFGAIFSRDWIEGGGERRRETGERKEGVTRTGEPVDDYRFPGATSCPQHLYMVNGGVSGAASYSKPQIMYGAFKQDHLKHLN